MTAEWQWTVLCCNTVMPVAWSLGVGLSLSWAIWWVSSLSLSCTKQQQRELTLPSSEQGPFLWSTTCCSCQSQMWKQQVHTFTHSPAWQVWMGWWQDTRRSDRRHIELPQTQAQDPRTIRLTLEERIYLVHKISHPFLTPKLESISWLQQIKILKQDDFKKV